MPIHHKIGSHQRQHIGRAKTKRRQQSPKSTRRHHKYSNDQRLSRKASKANSDLWLDFNVDASLSESEDELQGLFFYSFNHLFIHTHPSRSIKR